MGGVLPQVALPANSLTRADSASFSEPLDCVWRAPDPLLQLTIQYFPEGLRYPSLGRALLPRWGPHASDAPSGMFFTFS